MDKTHITAEVQHEVVRSRYVQMTLRLTEDDARALLTVTHKIGGCPTGARGLFDRIRVALEGVGFSSYEATSASGNIIFED